jgi:hypothetical protein
MCSAARFASLSHSPPHGARPSTPHSFSPIPHSPPLFRPPAPIPATPRDADPRPSASSRLSSSRCRCVAATAVMLGPSVYRQPEETIISCHVLRLAPPHRVVGLLRHPPHGCRCRTSPPRCHGQPCQDKALASCPLRVPFTQLAPLAGTPALLCARMRPPRLCTCVHGSALLHQALASATLTLSHPIRGTVSTDIKRAPLPLAHTAPRQPSCSSKRRLLPCFPPLSHRHH